MRVQRGICELYWKTRNAMACTAKQHQCAGASWHICQRCVLFMLSAGELSIAEARTCWDSREQRKGTAAETDSFMCVAPNDTLQTCIALPSRRTLMCGTYGT